MSQFQCPNRLRTFKNRGKDSEEMRRRRSTVTTELRKASRDSNILKRRNVQLLEEEEPVIINPEDQSIQISSIVEGLRSSDEQVLLKAVRDARKMLSNEKTPPIAIMIEAGIVPPCVQLLSSPNPDLQFELCWALTNIACGNSEQTNEVVKAGAIPRLVELVKSPHVNIAEQAVWTLGNIAGDGPALRDQVIAAGVIPLIRRLAESKVPSSTLKTIAWMISNLCRNRNPPPPFNEVRNCLPIIYELLSYKDSHILSDMVWALSYLTDGPDNKIQAVVDAGVVPQLVELLSAEDVSVLTPAVRAVGNIVTGSEEHTDCVINAGALPKFRELLRHEKMSIVKEAAWSISNITAGTLSQIQAIIDNHILPPLIKVLESGDFKSQKEAAWAVTNFTSGANSHQLSVLLRCGVLPSFCKLLGAKDAKTVAIVLDGINNILSRAMDIGELDRVAIMIEECGGVDQLEALLKHDAEELYQKALKIIENYFQNEDIDDTIVPAEVSDQFKFNAEEPTGKYTF